MRLARVLKRICNYRKVICFFPRFLNYNIIQNYYTQYSGIYLWHFTLANTDTSIQTTFRFAKYHLNNLKNEAKRL